MVYTSLYEDKYRLRKGNKIMAVITFTTFCSLPCKAKIFTINDIEADIADFGYDTTYNNSESEEELDIWGCRGREWHRYSDESLLQEACVKYGINQMECDEICDILEAKLSIGDCGWCI